jgi:hypothetical protein
LRNSSLFNNKQRQDRKHLGLLFGLLWIVLCAVYFPAAKAGFVADYTGWLEQVRSQGFWNFINRTNFQAKSLYQFTQFNTYVLYKLLGTSEWLWHIVFITLHALNACLLFVLCNTLLQDSGAKNTSTTATVGALLFCISPYISEVVIWEPAFHFLQGLLLILLILVCVQQYIHTLSSKYLWLASAIYLLSLFSLEVFYITPWLVLSLGIFYTTIPTARPGTLKRVALYSCLPMLILFIVRFAVYRLYYGDWISRVGSGTVDVVSIQSFGKPAKYLFHLLAVGRFFPDGLKRSVYDFCDSLAGIVAFYGLIVLIGIPVVGYYKKVSGKLKVAILLFIWMMMALLLLVPLWFQADMLVWFDRYSYFAGAFFYMLFAVLVSFITVKYVRIAVWAMFALANLRFAIQVSRYWGKSYNVVHGLLNNIPDDRNKTMILLNLPANMHGVPMIGAEKNSEYKLMHDLLIPEKTLTNTVYDVLAYNMLTPADGAHVNVINDSMIKVTLNQWGTWWWFETKGGYSYWTADYKLDLKDAGHWYELTLRKPADQYILLYSVGGEWKKVDMSKREGDQN